MWPMIAENQLKSKCPGIFLMVKVNDSKIVLEESTGS